MTIWIAFQLISDCPYWLDINRVTIAIFDSEEKAKAYCETAKTIHEYGVAEMEVNSEVPGDEDYW